ncbi:uncharacterized protein HGUI_03547 [Hanseniaspora guilliermondii]|uniref:BZIP domain-containing protein n=1 Tax=Hanseniaspora guilliermondii TaxID=56406 RepID=A0A1L0B4P0_9ASCO|nr:uncharacterized protein HGUI_03547 [Hanseniaspora guilliermondii]
MSLHYLPTDNFGGMNIHENYEGDLYSTNDIDFFDAPEDQGSFNSINPLIVRPLEEDPKYKVNKIINEPLTSRKFTDYVNHYELLDGENKEELENFYDLKDLDLSFMYNESFNKIIDIANGSNANFEENEFELDKALVDIIGLDNMVFNAVSKKYRVDHTLLTKKQKYELKKYRNRKASKKFRYKKKNKKNELSKHLSNLNNICDTLENKVDSLLTENKELKNKFKAKLTNGT